MSNEFVLPTSTRFLPDLVYARTAQRSLALDLYLPPSGPTPLPLIAWTHGGAFRMGSKADTGDISPLLADGYAIASIGYRLSQEAIFPALVRDVKAAVRWLRLNAAQYNLDPDRIVSAGPSAGGYLAAMLGTAGHVTEWDQPGDHVESAPSTISSAVQAVVDLFGPTDFLRMNAVPGVMDHDAADSPESQLIGAPIQQNPDKVAAANPITYITPDAPPFIIFHGDQDLTVLPNQSQMLHAALTRAGVPSTLIIVPGKGHGFGDKHAGVLDQIRVFLKQTL